MRIVFMGTPQFAVASLDILVKSKHDVVAVITATDKYGGRGRKKLLISDVKKYALEHDIPILQPPNLKNEQFQEKLKSFNADLQVVVAFRMLPVSVWDMPPLGTYNLHGSLLPSYRGAAPINWAIMNGDEFTGVTTFKLKHEIDTGSIAYQEKIPIYKNDNVATVHDRMMEVGAQTVLKTVKAIDDKSIKLEEQSESNITKAPKIFHQDCSIDITGSVVTAYNKIRGLNPFPTAWTKLDDKKLKVFDVKYSYENQSVAPGTFVYERRSKKLKLYLKDGFIELLKLQIEGKRKMDVRDFINGFNLRENNLPFLLSDQ